MKELVIATRNRDKTRELVKLLRGLRISVRALEQYRGCPEVREGRRSFRENAILKAMAVSKFTGKLALADDSGLEVDALDGRPGVCSSRFAGKTATYADNNRKLLSMLKARKAKTRGAQFRCVVAIYAYPELIGVVEGKIRGRIAQAPRGRYGFGYDPVFIVPKLNRTFAQLKPAVKNTISHRAQALNKAKRLLERYYRRLG